MKARRVLRNRSRGLNVPTFARIIYDPRTEWNTEAPVAAARAGFAAARAAVLR